MTLRNIFLFWVPLAVTWFMMTIEQPYLMAVIARLGEPKFNLAAFGVAYSFALIIEAPVIMLMSASTALVNDKEAYFKLRTCTHFLNITVTIIMVLCLIPAVFYFIVGKLIGLPEPVARLTHISALFMIPWAAAIGYRRFYQGILIRNHLTRRVTYGTVIRLLTMSATALIGYSARMKGAYTGALSLTVGVVCEAIASRAMADRPVKALVAESVLMENDVEPLTYPNILKFYIPLALTSIVSLGVHPFVTFFMGRSHLAIESLAVLPVVSSLVFVFRSIGLSYQEVGIALIGEKKQNYQHLRNFATILGIATVAGLSLIAFSPLASVWFSKVSGLSLELTGLASLPLRIMVLLPSLSVLISFQRSILIIANNTRAITIATAIELTTIVLVLLVTVIYLNFFGAVAAACAYLVGKLSATLYLAPKQIRAARS